jgi:hypothetical protein
MEVRQVMSNATRTDVVVGSGYLRYKQHGFDTIDFISPTAHAEFIEPHKEDSSYKIVRDIPNNRSFYASSSMSSIVEITKTGDTKATASLLDGLKEISSESESNSGVSMDIEGVAYDMGSVVSGEPECCIAMDNPTVKQSITILIDLGYSGEASAKSINYRSVGIVNLISTLQAQGYILNVQCGRFADCYGSKYGQIVSINTETLCIAQMASATSVGYYRGACWLTTAMQKGDKSYNGSSTSRLTSSIIDKLTKDNIFYIAGGFTCSRMTNLKSPQEGIDIVVELFNKFCESKGKVKV